MYNFTQKDRAILAAIWNVNKQDLSAFLANHYASREGEGFAEALRKATYNHPDSYAMYAQLVCEAGGGWEDVVNIITDTQSLPDIGGYEVTVVDGYIKIGCVSISRQDLDKIHAAFIGYRNSGLDSWTTNLSESFGKVEVDGDRLTVKGEHHDYHKTWEEIAKVLELTKE